MPWLLQWEKELGKLDQLLALLAAAPPSPESEIAQEHIQSARSHVWGQCPTDGVASRGSECVTSIACRGLSSLSLLARMERRDQYNANR